MKFMTLTKGGSTQTFLLNPHAVATVDVNYDEIYGKVKLTLIDGSHRYTDETYSVVEQMIDQSL